MSVKKIPVLVVGPIGNIGGLGTYINNLVNSKLKKNFEFFCFNDKNGYHEGILNVFSHIIHFFYLLKQINGSGVRYVLINNNSIGFSFLVKYFQVIICKLCAVPSISRFGSGKTIDGYNNYKIHTFLLQSYLKMNYKIIVQTEYSKNFFKSLITENKIHILPNFILDNNRIVSTSSKKKAINVLFTIGYDKSSSKNKGSFIVLEFLKKYPYLTDYFRFFCILTDNSFLSECQKANLHKRISFIKPKDNKLIHHFYKNIDIFLFLSESEGFPNTLVELMSNGASIISTGNGAIPEIIDDNKGGFIIDSRTDFEYIKNKLLILKDNEIRDSFSKYNISKVNKNYSEDNFTTEFKKIVT